MRTPVSNGSKVADPKDVTGLERTYRELRERTDCLARHLRAMGIPEAAILEMPKTRSGVRGTALR